MVRSVRPLCAVAVLLAAWGSCPAADEPLSRVEIGKIGKAGTVLVEVKQRGYGSAFCVHPGGLFVTNEHVVRGGDVNVVLNPGQKDEKVCKAKVVRSDLDLDLALLRIEDVKDLPTLRLGSDEKLAELMEVVAVGFPFGTALSPDKKGYPEVSINVGSVTALRKKDDALHRIQLDAALNPGNSGGPVLDKEGKVVGVVVAGVQGSGVNFAIPISVVSKFLAVPDVQFDPPQLGAANLYKSVTFEARVQPVLPAAGPITVDLVLKPAGGKERTHRMEAADGKYRVSAVPLPPPNGPLPMRLLAQFDNGAIRATTDDRAFKVGDREVRLSEVARVHTKPTPGVVLADGKTVEGAVTGLDEVPVRLGEQSLAVNLGKAATVSFSLAPEADLVWCTLVVRQGDKEVARRGEGLVVQGLLPSPAPAVARAGIRPPELEEAKVVRKLTTPIGDVAVGGAGRYLILHLPKLRQLAVFDVSAAKVVGRIPLEEDSARFAAGLEDVVVVLPRAGTIERWGLKTLERDVVATLPVKGAIKGVAMGSASRGPLLVHAAVSHPQGAERSSYVLLNVQTMKPITGDLAMPAQVGFNQNLMHLRASAEGKVFGLWCTNQFPSGLTTLVVSDTDVKSYYAHQSVGPVLPTPDGKAIYTGVGKYRPQVTIQEKAENGTPMVPGCHGEQFLMLPAPGKEGSVTVHLPGKAEPVATLPDLVTIPKEEAIKHDFTFDKRFHLIPEARVVIVIPASDDQLILYRLGN
jgi:S1-C subfamily serine protease